MGKGLLIPEARFESWDRSHLPKSRKHMPKRLTPTRAALLHSWIVGEIDRLTALLDEDTDGSVAQEIAHLQSVLDENFESR